MQLVDRPVVNITIQLNSKFSFNYLKHAINLMPSQLAYSFDPEQDRWVLSASMKSKRLAVGVAVVNRLVNL